MTSVIYNLFDKEYSDRSNNDEWEALIGTIRGRKLEDEYLKGYRDAVATAINRKLETIS